MADFFSKNDQFSKVLTLPGVFGVAQSKTDVRFRTKQNGGPNMADFFLKIIHFSNS